MRQLVRLSRSKRNHIDHHHHHLKPIRKTRSATALPPGLQTSRPIGVFSKRLPWRETCPRAECTWTSPRCSRRTTPFFFTIRGHPLSMSSHSSSLGFIYIYIFIYILLPAILPHLYRSYLVISRFSDLLIFAASKPSPSGSLVYNMLWYAMENGPFIDDLWIFMVNPPFKIVVHHSKQ